MADDATWDHAWQQALDRLEADLLAAEALLLAPADEPGSEEIAASPSANSQGSSSQAPVSETPAWTPPNLTTPLPVVMQGRARELLARQTAVADALSIKAQALRQQEKLVSGGSFEKPGPRPAYLDISA